MFFKTKRIVSFLVAVFMTVSLFPVNAEGQPSSYTRVISGNNSAVYIGSSGDYKISAGAMLNGAVVDGQPKAALTIGNNLNVTLWFDGNVKIQGLDATFEQNIPSSGIYVGSGSTLTLRKIENSGYVDIIIRGGDGYRGDKMMSYVGSSGGAAGIGTFGAPGGKNYGDTGSNADPFPGKKVIIDDKIDSLRIYGGYAGEAIFGNSGDRGDKWGGVIKYAYAGAGGDGGGGGGDRGAAIGTGGGGGGAGGKGGDKTKTNKGSSWAAVGGSGGGGAGQGAMRFYIPSIGIYAYNNGGGGGGGGSAIKSKQGDGVGYAGQGGNPSIAEKNIERAAKDGENGEDIFAGTIDAFGGEGGKADGTPGKGGDAREVGDEKSIRGNDGTPGGKAGAAHTDFDKVYYLTTISAEVNPNIIYDGQEISAGQGSGKDFIVSSNSYSLPKFSYRKYGSGSSFTSGTPVNAGKYEMKGYYPEKQMSSGYKYEAISTTAELTIHPRSVNDSRVTVEYDDALEYNGQQQAPQIKVLFDGKPVSSSDYEIKGRSAATEIGTYSFTVQGKNNFKDESFSFEWSVTYPHMEGVTTHAEDTVYDGQPHSGSVTVTDPADAVITYSTEQNGTYETEAPQFTEAGDHKIYYKAELDQWQTAEGFMTVKIAPKPVELNWTETTFPYDGHAHKPVATVTNALEGDEVFVTVGGEQTSAGTHTATATGLTGAAASNYKLPAEKTVSFEITKADSVVTQLPWAIQPTYNGEQQALVEAGVTSDGTMVYSLTKEGPYSEEIPVGINAGPYDVWYKVLGDVNHADTEPQKVEALIWRMPIEHATIVLGESLTYNGQIQEQTVISVTTDNGLSVPTFEVTGNRQTDAGTYTLKVKGTGNFAGDQTKEFTIAPYEVTIMPDADQSKIFGSEDPELTYTVELFGEDTLGGKLTREQGEDTGSYAYTVDSLVNTNYTFKLADNAPLFTITAKKVTAPVVTLDQTVFVYDGTAKTPAVVSVKDGNTVIDASEYETEILYRNNINVNEGAVAIIRDIPGGNYDLPAEFEVPFTILKSASELKEINISSNNVTYGDTFTVSFTPEILRQSNILVRLFTAAPESTKAELYYGNTKIAEDLTGITEGQMGTFTVNTLQQKIPASAFDGKEHELTIKWRGDSNLKESTGKIRTVLNKKALSATVNGEESRVYDGTTAVKEAVKLDLTGVLGTDAVTATATGSLSDKNVGTPSFIADKVVLGAEDAGYYSLAPEDVRGTVKVTARPLTLTWTNTEMDYNRQPQSPVASVETLVADDDVKVVVDGAQTDAGSYTATASITGSDAGNYLLPENNATEFVIRKVKAQFDPKPQPLELVENGHHQVLVIPGETEDGTILYKVEDNGIYGEALPTAKNPGMHKVWFKIQGDKNHYDSDEMNFHTLISSREEAGQNGGNPDKGAVNTSDNSSLAGWMMLSLVSLIAILAAGRKRKEER